MADAYAQIDTVATPPRFDQHVLWSYGSGNVGFGDGELAGPHSAVENPFDPDEIAVSEQYGCSALLIHHAALKIAQASISSRLI